MGHHNYTAFITKTQKYALIDEDGDIRGTAPEFEGAVLLKNKYGWGNIRKMKFDGKTLKIGKVVG